ncbi:uncharacterized protein PADG_02476 [Paracoccidioides brasiliensis Pb18]|uniref:BTB domain-containing protein n=1 Tax=Paracoccidioides brasiliensis (strain Pb18) TaxID=502780 RepID=C1G5M1_PARBD|nr:uncharacterized protein PADG_02476 [Paracoccidioides brasiliensis Pb18]EEH46378.2 hypothetical protein PADG_02476 [Paracoccidioides brasiliensis Pb18]
MAAVPVPDFHRLPADPSLFSIIGHNSIVLSPSFTFLVGPEHTKLTIQSGLAKHVSQRLDELMNNGHTRESRHRIAVLEEEDVETFVGFCEYAYTGDYTVPNPKATLIGRGGSEGAAGLASPLATPTRPPAPSPPATPQPGEELQITAGDGGEEREGAAEGGEEKVEEEQDDDVNQESSKGKRVKGGKKKQKGGAAKGAQGLDEVPAANLTPPRTPPPIAELAQQTPPAAAAAAAAARAQRQILVYPPQKPSLPRPTGSTSKRPLSLKCPNSTLPPKDPSFPLNPTAWVSGAKFASLQYIHHQSASGGMALPSPLSRNTPGYGIAVSGTEPIPYLLFHAKIYVFATRFQIPTLAQLTLQKLHRDLISFPLSATTDNLGPSSAAAVIQLLHFAFTRTTRDDPVFTLTGPNPTAHRQNELRKLVTHYAACKVRELVSYEPVAPSLTGMESVDTSHLGFRDLLDSLGELASDLVYRMVD